MNISKKQLLKIIREEAKSTKKYDMDKHLTPKQGKELPDAMQKGIIDKEEEEEKEEKNEALKKRLRRILNEVMAECPMEGSQMPCPIKTAAEMKDAGATGDDLLHWIDLLISEFGKAESMGPIIEPKPADGMLIEPDPLYDEVEELVGMPIGGGGG